MGSNPIADQLHALADRVAAAGDELKANALAALESLNAKIEAVLDKAEEGEDIEPEAEGSTEAVPEAPAEGFTEGEATQLPAGEDEATEPTA